MTAEDLVNQIIFQELTSPLGNPPIYGYYRVAGAILGDLSIIDKTKSDDRMVSRGRLCGTFTRDDLINLLLQLKVNIDNSLNYRRETLCDVLTQALIDIGHII